MSFQQLDGCKFLQKIYFKKIRLQPIEKHWFYQAIDFLNTVGRRVSDKTDQSIKIKDSK